LPEPVLRAHKFLVEHANLVITVSEGIRRDLIALHAVSPEKVRVIKHGADTQFVRLTRELLKTETNVQRRKPVAVLVGIPATTDISLLQHLVKEAPSVDFLIVGPFRVFEKRMFRGLRNIKFLGLLEHADVMRILTQSDVGLILYKKKVVEILPEGSTGMKLYDYAAAGLPIVSVPLPITDETPPICFATEPKEFVQAIQYCVEHKTDLSAKALAFAERNSWEKRQNEFVKLIEEALRHVSRGR